MGGWNATSALSCNSTFGPKPFFGTAPTTVRKGSAGPAMRPKKKAATTRVTSVAHATRGSADWRRKRHTMAVMYPERISPHNRIDPANADHRPVTV